MRTQRYGLGAIAIIVGLLIVLTGCGSDPLVRIADNTEQTTTQAPTTTRATTTTTTTTAPPPPVTDRPTIGDTTQEDFVYELWVDTGYCYTDCTRAYTPDEWLSAGEGYGMYAPADILGWSDFLSNETNAQLDLFCDNFWALPDYEVASIAEQSGLPGGAAIVASYIWCDS